MRAALIVALALAVACGGRQRPAPPPTPDPAAIARQLHADLVELGAIAKRHRGDCPALVRALEPHVAAMRATAAEAQRAMADPALAPRVKAESARYDVQAEGLGDAIGEDLGASYRTCPNDRRVLELIDQLPEL